MSSPSLVVAEMATLLPTMTEWEPVATMVGPVTTTVGPASPSSCAQPETGQAQGGGGERARVRR